MIPSENVEPRVKVLHKRVEFVGSSKNSNISILLWNITFEDEGDYICFAKNPKEKNRNHSAVFTLIVVDQSKWLVSDIRVQECFVITDNGAKALFICLQTCRNNLHVIYYIWVQKVVFLTLYATAIGLITLFNQWFFWSVSCHIHVIAQLLSNYHNAINNTIPNHYLYSCTVKIVSRQFTEIKGLTLSKQWEIKTLH